MSDNEDSIMIAFLPTYATWVKQELPHMTLVFAGLVSEAGPNLKRDMTLDTAMIAAVTPKFSLLSLGVDQFGEGMERVDVLRLLKTTPLEAVRRMVERHNKSQYTDYKPHITIGPVGSAAESYLPEGVTFDRILLAWGDEHLVFFLR